MQINQRSTPALSDGFHRAFKRGVAIAAGRTEYVPHQAVRVHANEYWRGALVDVPTNKRDVRLATIHLAFIRHQSELAVKSSDQCFSYAVNVALVRHAIAYEFGNGEHLHLMLTAESDEVRDARHRSIVLHDFANNAGRNHAREPCQINSRLGLPGSNQNATFPRT